MKKFITVSTLVIMFSSMMVGCSSTNSGLKKEETIKIGLQAPMTGDNGQYGIKIKEGIDLAFKNVNNNGGVHGKKLELVVGDDKATPSEAVAVVNKMITKDQVKAVIGGFNSSPTIATQEVTGNAKIPQLHMGASPDLSKKNNKYLFRTILTDSIYVPTVMKYMVEQQKSKKIVALYENTDYGTALSDAAKKSASSLGAELVDAEAYNPGDKDFSAQITKIKKMNPDTLMIAGLYNEAALIAQQARQAGLNVKLFSPSDGVDSQQLITLGGKDVENFIFASMIDLNSDSKEITEFKKLCSDNKITPEAYTAIAYDAAMVLTKALEQGDGTSEKVRDALATIKYQGVTGPIYFDANGDRTNTPLVMQVKNSKFVKIQDSK
jgi:branched-chain amino acid transport system substrate-binding protein